MSSQSFELNILLSLRDQASRGIDANREKLRALGKEGRESLKAYERDSKAAMKTFEDLQKDFSKGAAATGIGVAGFVAMYKGVKVAAEFEDAMLGLKSAFQETGQDARVFADQMNRAEVLGIDLGNQLQGTTQDYLQIFAALKQAGVETETILGGAGKSAGYLANVSGTIRTGAFIEQAKELGQFGKLFKLKPEDFEATVNLFSALKDRFDIESSSLIESAKYFQSTASSLGMTGLEGATDTARLFAFIKRNAALEGSTAGTSVAAMITQFVTHKKQLAELKKATGVDLNLFETKGKDKGKFLGLDNAFKEAEKLRGLQGSIRKEALVKAFGTEGEKVFGAMVDAGLDGWKSFVAESKKAVEVNAKINAQMETFNSKLEAVQGSISNLVASGFTPMLNSVKPILDGTNSLIGNMQAFGKEHPNIAKVASAIFGVGSTTLVVTGAITMLTAKWRMWKIVSAVSSGDTQLLTFLQNVQAQTTTTAAGLGSAATRAAWYKRELTGVPAVLGTTLVLTVGAEVLAYIYQLKQEADAAWAEAKGTATSTAKATEKLYASPASSQQIMQMGQAHAPASLDAFITGINARLKQEQLEQAPSPIGAAVPIYGAYDILKKAFYQPEAGQNKIAQDLKSYMPELKMPAEFAFFIDAVNKRKDLSGEEKKNYIQGANTAFPESAAQYERAMQEAGAAGYNHAEALRSLVDADKAAAIELGQQLAPNAMSAAKELKALGERAAVTNLSPPKTDANGNPVKVQSNAVGGRVQSDGMVHVHAGEHIVPARVSQPYREGGRASSGGMTVSGGIHLHVNVPKGSAAAENPEKFGEFALKYISRSIKKQREKA